MNITETISSISDKRLRFIPIRPTKAPIPSNWQNDTTTVYDYSQSNYVGLVCGAISGNVEVIDFDLKYDLSGTLFRDFKRAVNDIDKNLLSKMVVQKTMSGGYHFIYRCSHIEGNQKIANRETTEEEKRHTYESTFHKKAKELGVDINVKDEKYHECDRVAKASMINDKVRVLIETRGEKGQIACVPSPSYEFVYGNFDSIQEITPQERDILFNVAYSFNSVLKADDRKERTTYTPKKTSKGLTPFEDYNDRADVVQLLINHGWTYVHTRGRKVMLRRPGNTSAETSGNYDEEYKWFSVFSTSTEFDPMKAYQPYAVFAILECKGDFSEAAKRLSEMGYGDKEEETKSARVEVRSVVDTTDDDLSFLSSKEEESTYIQSWINGTFEKGLSTGMDKLDKHFLFKPGNLVMYNGLDNVGKSTLVWFMAMLSAKFHGWNWIIFSSENKPAAVRKKLMEFYWDKPLIKQSTSEREEAEKFTYSHFEIIKNAENMYNYMDILNMTKKIMTVSRGQITAKKKYHGLMIDPYNSLKVDSPKSGSGKGYDYHYEAASVMKLFGSTNDISIHLNLHVGTGGARNVDKDGMVKPPQKADTEMGVMFPNKADEFITIHRNVQHESEFMFTELHVRKVKELETGGSPTSMYKPVILRANYSMTGFTCVDYKDRNISGENPIKKFLSGNQPKQSSIFNVSEFTDYPETDDSEPIPF